MIVKAMMTQKHINNGARNDSAACPIALLLEEATGYTAEADYCDIQLHNNGLYHVVTPKKLEEFMRAFDLGEKVELIEIDLEFKLVEQDESIEIDLGSGLIEEAGGSDD